MVGLVRQPTFRSRFPKESPGAPSSTMKEDIPFGSPSTLAVTTYTPATPPEVTHALVPSRT